MEPVSALIFTDLDGTLLDPHDYSFDAARPALDAVHALRIPLILTTSKTLPEVAEISRSLGSHEAAIVENGGALCFPLDRRYPFEIDAHEEIYGYAVIRFSPPYAVIRDFIERQRAAHGWPLRGFGDMTVDEVAERTGLGSDEAGLAKQRLCSEPFVWQGSAEGLTAFRDEVRAAQLVVTRGGRFHHLMGRTSKAEGLHAMRSLFAAEQRHAIPVIALGDSENDSEMLAAADIAVIVRRHDGTHLDCHGIKRTLRTELAGPAGWNAAVLQILEDLGVRARAT
jgi:mannosyl-3-phosphoglycerate phosphatase